MNQTQTPLTAPLDATHTRATLAVKQIRDAVAVAHAAVARWTPRPCPPDWRPTAGDRYIARVTR